MNVPKPRFYDSFVNLLAGLGVPGRDKFMSQQYVHIPMSQHECETAYRSDWIAKKVVDIPAWDMTRQWRAWQADQDQIQAIESAEKTLFVQQKVQQAIIKARLYGGALIVIGVEQGDPAQELDLEQVGQDSLKFLHVIPQHRITVGPLILDVMSPYYGMPEYYEAQSQPGLTTPGLTTAATVSKSDPSGPATPVALSPLARGSNQWQVRLHPSRVVRFFGLVPPDPIQNAAIGGWGDSVLQPVNDAIKASGMVTGSLATMISEMKVDIIKIPQLTDVLSTDEGTRKMISRFSNANVAKSVINTLLLDAGEDWQRIETSLRGVPEVLEVYLMIAAGAADVPATRFLGRSPQGLNATGESDIRNYYDRLASEQSLTLTPAMNKLDEVIIRSALGDRPEEVYYNWNSLWQMTDAEKAAIALQKGQNYQIDVGAGQIPTSALAHARINQLIEDGVYPGLEQAITEAEVAGDTIEEHNAPAPVVPQGVDPATGKPLPAVDPKTGKPVAAPPGGNGAAPPPFGGKKAPPSGAAATDSEFDDDCALCDDDAEKDTQTDANYRIGVGNKRCANCEYFEAPEGCALVESPIQPQGLCDYFSRVMQDAEADHDDGPFGDDPCHEPGGSPIGGQFTSCEGGGTDAGGHDLVIRPEGWNASSDEVSSLTRPGHLYRGMTQEEYNATVDAGKGIQSSGAYSHKSEGTNFAGDAPSAESYINFGRDDPRRTGKPTYLIEVKNDVGITPSPDGYYKFPQGVPDEKITRIIEMRSHQNKVVGRFTRHDSDSFGDDRADPCHQPAGTSTGGQFVGCEGVGSGMAPGDHPGPGYSKKARVDANGVIQTTKVEDAQRALFENRRVELDQPRKVSTLIKRLGRTTKDMIEKGEAAPNFNLCNVTVKGTSLFCGGSKGIPRVQMPQLDTEQTKNFLKALKKEGFTVKKDTEYAAHLRATQNELSGVKVWQQTEKAKIDPSRLEKRLVVSRDNYILDGHHHWAAKIGQDAKNNKLFNNKKMRVSRVDASITQLLERAKKHSGPPKSVTQEVQIHFKKKKKDGVSDGIFDLDDHYDANGDFYLDLEDAEFVPCHEPGGQSTGGQFTGCEGGGGSSKLWPKPSFGEAVDEVNRASLTRKDVSDEDRWALRRYIENDYAFKINQALRGQNKDAKALKTGNEVLRAFDKNAISTKADITTFRGIKSDPFDKLKPGDSFVDKGFISTSANARWAQRMAKGGPLIEIQIPKGTKIVGGIAESQESELLLRPGSKFRVISRDTKKNHMIVRLQ